MIVKKLWCKVCNALASYTFTHKWPVFWWRRCGYKIGKNTVIGPGCLFLAWHHIDAANIDIEDDVAIGPRVMLIVRSHSISEIQKYGKATSSMPGKITIKKGAWIGAGAIILPNITIGECALIGAGAVVTKDVPSYTVAVGIPARVIKKFKRNDETQSELDSKI